MNCILRIHGKKGKSAKRLVCVGQAVLFPSGLVLFFHQYALGPGFALLFMKQRMSMIDMSELPNLLSLDAVSGSKNQIKGGGAEQQSA
jgi:hypothetical protein